MQNAGQQNLALDVTPIPENKSPEDSGLDDAPLSVIARVEELGQPSQPTGSIPTITTSVQDRINLTQTSLALAVAEGDFSSMERLVHQLQILFRVLEISTQATLGTKELVVKKDSDFINPIDVKKNQAPLQQPAKLLSEQKEEVSQGTENSQEVIPNTFRPSPVLVGSQAAPDPMLRPGAMPKLTQDPVTSTDAGGYNAALKHKDGRGTPEILSAALLDTWGTNAAPAALLRSKIQSLVPLAAPLPLQGPATSSRHRLQKRQRRRLQTTKCRRS